MFDWIGDAKARCRAEEVAGGDDKISLSSRFPFLLLITMVSNYLQIRCSSVCMTI